MASPAAKPEVVEGDADGLSRPRDHRPRPLRRPTPGDVTDDARQIAAGHGQSSADTWRRLSGT